MPPGVYLVSDVESFIQKNKITTEANGRKEVSLLEQKTTYM